MWHWNIKAIDATNHQCTATTPDNHHVVPSHNMVASDLFIDFDLIYNNSLVEAMLWNLSKINIIYKFIIVYVIIIEIFFHKFSIFMLQFCITKN